MKDQQEVVELEKGVYWLGVRQQSQLEVNVYLRVFKGKDSLINMIVDPGPPNLFNILVHRLKSVIGGPEKIHIAYVNHQDPDVAFNTMYLSKYNPKLKILCTEDTWRLIRFLDLKSGGFLEIDKFKSKRGKLGTGHIIQFVPTPFCHFRGATMLYDEESRVLFSGDLLGGVTFSEDLFATAANWNGIRTFHQIYMPSRDAIRLAIDQIRKLTPAPKIIAPQHGAIIKGNMIEKFLKKLYDLPVGLDLMTNEEINKDFFIEAINDILENISARIDEEFVNKVLKKFRSDGTFPNLFEIKGNRIQDIKVSPRESYEMLVEALLKNQPKPNRENVKSIILKATVDWNLPLSKFLVEEKSDTSEIVIDAIDKNVMN